MSARNSYSSMTAATAILLLEPPLSTRTTRPLQRTRMLSVSVIFRWQGQGEIEGGAGLHRRIDIEADTAGTNIASLRSVLFSVLTVADTDWETKREPSGGPFVLFFLLGFGHATSGGACKHGG